MTHSLKKSCEHDLSFPFHKAESAVERLAALQSYAEENGLNREYLGEGKASALLEKKLCQMFGKPAVLWLPTGTMAQAIAARIHTSYLNTDKVVLHPTSHLLLHENDGYKHAHRLKAILKGEWSEPLTATIDNTHNACVFIELPQRHNGGLLPDWESLRALKDSAAQRNLKLHMDGARIWSCRPFYGNRSYSEIVDGFASIYISFYKDIGAIGGAALIGDEEFIQEAKIWQSRLGGLMIEPWPMIIDALRLLDLRVSQMEDFVRKAKELASEINMLPNMNVEPYEPHINLFHVRLPCSVNDAEAARNHTAEETGIWLANRFWDYESTQRCSMEITIGEKALALQTEQLIHAFSVMADQL